jgi:hypothetical protein
MEKARDRKVKCMDWEVVLTAFMLGSAIIQGIVEGSLRIFVCFFVPCLILLLIQYRRIVIIPARLERRKLKEEFDKFEKRNKRKAR